MKPAIGRHLGSPLHTTGTIMDAISRRTFSRQALGSLLTYSLLETAFRHDLFAGEVKPIAAKWVADLNDLSRAVQNQKLPQLDWQKKIEELFAQVDLPELIGLMDFDRLAAESQLVDNGARSIRFKFPEVEGLPKDLVFGKQIFGLKKGRSVVPHGHNNMATAFLILQGDLHGRHYDRVEDQAEHIIIKPTIDRKFKPGEYSTVSDFKDNVHWFEATSERAYIFNIHVLNVKPGGEMPTGRVYLNPNGEKLKDKLIRAPRLGYKEVHEMFG
jgi:hypothetical protein